MGACFHLWWREAKCEGRLLICYRVCLRRTKLLSWSSSRRIIVQLHSIKLHLFLLFKIASFPKLIANVFFRNNSRDNNFSLVLCQSRFGWLFLVSLWFNRLFIFYRRDWVLGLPSIWKFVRRLHRVYDVFIQSCWNTLVAETVFPLFFEIITRENLSFLLYWQQNFIRVTGTKLRSF